MNSFYYATGRVRALEAKLLTPEQITRLAGAADLAAALNVLSETVYADALTEMKLAFDFEELTNREQEKLRHLMASLAPGNDFVAALTAGRTAADLFRLKRLCRAGVSPLLQALVNHKIDLLNLKTVIRCQLLKKDRAFLAARLAETGTLDRESLLGLLNLSPAEIPAKLAHTSYFPFLAPGLELLAKTGSAALLEKLMADFTLTSFRRAKYLAGGLEPLIGYYLAKEAEIRTLRFIFICKQNLVRTEQVAARVRTVY